MRALSLRRFAEPLSGLAGSLGATLTTSFGVRATGASPIAIDLGSSGIKLLQLDLSDAASPTLIAAACLETPEALRADHGRRLLWQIEQLPRLIREGGFKGKRAVCSIPASQTYCKHAQLARAEGGELEQAVRAMLGSQLSCDPSLLVHRQVEVPVVAPGGKMEVICMATSRELVQKLMAGLKAAKVELVGVHSEFHATLRAFETVARRADDKGVPTLYLDVGSSTTKAMITHGKDMVFARLIETGGNALDAAVGAQLKLEGAEARTTRLELEALHTKGTKPIGEQGEAGVGAGTENQAEGMTRVDLSEPLEMLTDELCMCLRYHETLFPGKKVERAVFTGGEARHKGLCQHIARSIRLPAQVADPMARITRSGKEPAMGLDLRAPQPGWAVALGLCLSPTDL